MAESTASCQESPGRSRTSTCSGLGLRQHAGGSEGAERLFRRVIDAYQLKGLSLALALQKYDAMNYLTGDVVPGDQYAKIPIEALIWAPHRFK